MSNDVDIAMLVDMGFDPDKSKIFLERYSDTNRALEALIQDASSGETSTPEEVDIINPSASMEECINVLIQLGFSEDVSKLAITATNKKSTQAAIEYIYAQVDKKSDPKSPRKKKNPRPSPKIGKGIKSNLQEPSLLNDKMLQIWHHIPKRDPAYQTMVDMGFPPKNIRDALILAQNDVYQAINYLMSTTSEYDNIPFMQEVNKFVNQGFEKEIVKKEIVKCYESMGVYSYMRVEHLLYHNRRWTRFHETDVKDHWKFTPENKPPPEVKWTKLMEIPTENLLEIVQFLPFKDNLNVSLVNKIMYSCSKSNLIWYDHVVGKESNFLTNYKDEFQTMKVEGPEKFSLAKNVRDVGIKALWSRVTRSRVLKDRKVWLESQMKKQKIEAKERSILPEAIEHPILTEFPRTLLVVVGVLWILTILVSLTTFPLALDYFPQGYWWCIPYAPIFLLSIFTLFFVLFKWTYDGFVTWPWYICGRSGFSVQQSGTDEELKLEDPFLVFLIPPCLFFIITGIVLVIPGARDVGFWRFYYIPVLISLLWAIYLHFVQLEQKTSQVDLFRYALYYISIIFVGILLVLDFGLIASKMDAVPLFDRIQWSRVYTSLYLTHIFVFFMIAATFQFMFDRDYPRILGIAITLIQTVVLSVLASPISITILLLGLKLDGIIQISFLVAMIPVYTLVFILMCILFVIGSAILGIGFCFLCSRDD